MNFEHAFNVQAPIEQVWQTLLDIERVAPCMPGAEVLERAGEDAYRVGVRVKLGPISLLYRGQVEVVERDEDTHAATMRARAQEARGQGTANATVKMGLMPASGGGTEAQILTELALSGRAAAMGRGVIGEVSGQLIDEFARNLQAMLAPPAPPERAAPPPSASAPPPAASSAAAQPAPAAPGTAAQPATAAPQPSPPASSLAAGALAARMVAARLADPRALLGAAAGVLLAGALGGYALGRSRRRRR